jgi:hypothetical protein
LFSAEKLRILRKSSQDMKNPLHALKVKIVPELIFTTERFLFRKSNLTKHNDDFVEAV